MANGNGNSWILKTLVGFLFTIAFGSIMFMGKSVIANDEGSRDRDSAQIKETSNVQADIREIKTAQIYMQKDMDEMRVEQKTGFQEVKQLIAQMQTR